MNEIKKAIDEMIDAIEVLNKYDRHSSLYSEHGVCAGLYDSLNFGEGFMKAVKALDVVPKRTDCYYTGYDGDVSIKYEAMYRNVRLWGYVKIGNVKDVEDN